MNSNSLGPYSLTSVKLSKKSALDQIRIKGNGLADLRFNSVFTKEGSAEQKKFEKSHIAMHKLITFICFKHPFYAGISTKHTLILIYFFSEEHFKYFLFI